MRTHSRGCFLINKNTKSHMYSATIVFGPTKPKSTRNKLHNKRIKSSGPGPGPGPTIKPEPLPFYLPIHALPTAKMSRSFSFLSIESLVSIELDDSQNPDMAESAKRPREELNEDDELCTQAAGTGKSTCVHPVKEPIIDDGSTGGVLQQKEDEGSVAEEDMYMEDDLWEEDSDATIDSYESDNYEYIWCDSCVDNEVCKDCGFKDGFPPDYKVPPILEKCECFRCGGDDTYWSPDCPYHESRIEKCGKAFEEWKKLMRSRREKDFCTGCDSGPET